MRDVTLYLSDILVNIREARRFVGTMSYEQFCEDKKTSYAVVRCLEIIGEATKNVPPEIRSSRPQVPWRLMAGMRDKCIHAYFGVSHRTVWEAIQKELPPLEPHIESLLDDLRSDT